MQAVTRSTLGTSLKQSDSASSSQARCWSASRSAAEALEDATIISATARMLRSTPVTTVSDLAVEIFDRRNLMIRGAAPHCALVVRP